MPKLTATCDPGFRVYLRKFIVFIMIFSSLEGYSQDQFAKGLKENILKARSDSERVAQMGKLTRYYYANNDFVQGDSMFERQVMLAESTLKKHIVLDAYFTNTAYLISTATTKERLTRIMGFIKRALEHAKAYELSDYIALAYSHMAAVYLMDGKPDDAFRNSNLATTTAMNTSNDSVQVITTIQHGKVFQEKADIVMAFKVFTNAHNIALQKNEPSLLPPVLHAMADLYKKFNKYEEAKIYVNQSLSINTAHQNIAALVNDNIVLAKLSTYSAGKAYLQEAIRLSEKINSIPLRIEAEKILFVHMLLEEEPSMVLAFLEERPELKNVFINTGPSYLDWMVAEIYLYGGNPDSALYYFKKAEPSFNTGYDLSTRKSFFGEMAYCNQLLNNVPGAINYYQKSYELSRASSDIRRLKTSTGELRTLFEKQGDYKQAYQYGLMYELYKDSVDQMGKERDLALLEIEKVSRQQQRDAELARTKQQKKFNLQYMIITVIIVTAFLLMIMVGMFKVSAFTIRVMGFLSLIFFFEFIILLLDTWIHHQTHGEPWKIWLIKIGIISILLPVHHFLEHKLIHYLLSRHLIVVRGRLSTINPFRRNKSTVVAEAEPGVYEEDILLDQSQEAGGGQINPKSK